MIPRNAGVAYASANFVSSNISAASPPAPPLFSSGCSRDCRRHRRRRYATLHDDINLDSARSLHWPELGDPPRHPSPYQIFNQNPQEPYSKDSKRRFYELVKLYHPDRSNLVRDDAGSSSTNRISRAVMLERYRMVIAANTILSDPAKRDAYDRYGHGWTHHFSEGDPRHPYRYSTHHRWRTNAGGGHTWPIDQDPMYNATWEDWERWYRKQFARANPGSSSESSWANFFSEGRPRQSPVYASNYAFISVVFMLAALGGAGQATRANEQAKTHLERSQLVNSRTSKVLMEARENTRGKSGEGETKDSRIRRFLRDNGEYSEGEFDGRALRPGDEGLCAPGLTKDKDDRRYWQKPPENNR